MRCAEKAAKEAPASLRADGDVLSSNKWQTIRRLLPYLLNLQHLFLQAHVVLHHVLMMAPHWSSSTLVGRMVNPTQRMARSPRSPVETESEPSKKKARTDYKTALQYNLFGSDDGDESDRSSPVSMHAHPQ